MKILGLDLGVASIGWSLIDVENDIPQRIIDMGSRIIPLTPDDSNEFTTGKDISKNQKRTTKRGQRRRYDRYQQRREKLTMMLKGLKMLPDERLIKLPVIDLWQLRADAATEGHRLELAEIGRVLYHLNQRRGYKHAKSDAGDSQQREYVKNVNARYATIKERSQTIGQYFAEELKRTAIDSPNGKVYTKRIKNEVFPREAYIEEFDTIMHCQKPFYPEVLTDSNIDIIRNEIIYYQRGLKSCKHLVATCEFEKKEYVNKEGKTIVGGPKVAPRTSPIFQEFRIWQDINNISLYNNAGEKRCLTTDEKREIYNHIASKDKLTATDLYNILGISKKDGWWVDKKTFKGVEGNATKAKLKKILGKKYNALLDFQLETVYSDKVNTETGEVMQVISPAFKKQPLYKLWHVMYSIDDSKQLDRVLKNKFSIDDSKIREQLCNTDFVKSGFSSISTKAIRKILPHMMNGEIYSTACAMAGYNHSNSMTKAENEARQLLDSIPNIKRNELRQPIVEKILNQMINLVNRIISEYGRPDTIRVELARELKQSKEERASTTQNINRRERENKSFAEKIEETTNKTASRNQIEKYRLWEESGHRCFYCGRQIGLSEFIYGSGAEIEHVIPKSLFFDNSYSNKVCSCAECNRKKDNLTAYDFMSTKDDKMMSDYLNRIQELYEKGKISKTKRERLLTKQKDIPQDFLERDLRQSQYIARKAREILMQVCRNVYATTGSVTDFLRHIWGYDRILEYLNFERYEKAGLTETVEVTHKDNTYTENRIKDWSKRMDHRHHAIDALVIACTRQSYIQRLNNLNTQRDAMFAEIEKQSAEWKDNYNLLEEWVKERPHFTVEEVRQKVDSILVSFKAGKRVATSTTRYIYKNGKRTAVQSNIIVPRGPLTEDSVYGKIKTHQKVTELKKLFEHPEVIVNGHIRHLVNERIKEHDGDWKKACSSLKKNPIFIDKDNTIELKYATCYAEEYVTRYSVVGLKKKDLPYIIDERARQAIEARINEYGEKNAFKDLENNPIYLDKERNLTITSVRMKTGLKAVIPVKHMADNTPYGYAKPGNNHHIALYRNKSGELEEKLVSFSEAVKRKMYGLPVIIKDTKKLWDSILDKDLPQDLLETLPTEDMTFVMSMQQNEMFTIGMNEEELKYAIQTKNYSTIAKHLYRVQKLSNNYYVFRLHIDTSTDDDATAQKANKFVRIQSFKAFLEISPIKVKTDILGHLMTDTY